MKIRLEQFYGMVPRRNARLLPDAAAELAENTKLWSGKIKPWRANELVCDPFQTVPRSIYLFGKSSFPPGYWFQFSETDVNVVKGQVGGDETDRTYITGGPSGQPQVTDSNLAIRGNEEVWEAEQHYTTGNIVVGSGTSGVYFECTTAGTSFTIEPEWSVTPSNTTNDGTVVWTARSLTASGACSDLPDVTVNLGVPAPVDAPVAVRSPINGSIAGIDEYASTKQAQTGVPGTPFVVTSDGSSQTMTVSVRARFQISDIPDIGDAIDYRAWRDTAAVNPVDSDSITRDNWTIYLRPIPNQNEPGYAEHAVTLTETVALSIGDHSYSFSAIPNGFELMSVQGASDVTYSASYGPDGGIGGGLSIDLGNTEENPFSVGDQIRISGVVGVTNSNFEEINGVHDVVDVGGNVVMIALPNLDAADYSSGGTWEFVPNDLTTFDRFYVYTYIARMGTLLQEGPPSPVSTVLGLANESTVSISGMSVPPANYNISRIRIYRTVLGNDTTEFKFVDEIGASNTTYEDTLLEGSTNIGEVLLSEDWGPPPADLHSIVQMPNGIMVGLSKNEVFVSEAFQPHAWPDAYRRSMEFDGISAGVFGNTVLITTNGQPYLLTGNDPENMQMDKLEIIQSCISKRSTVDMGYSVLYASSDGLVQVGPGIARLVTEQLFTRDEWKELNPSSIRAARWDDRYVAFFTKADGTEGGFVFDPKNPESSYTTLSMTGYGGYTDPDSGDLFIIDGSNNIVQFDKDETQDVDFLWRSKRFHLPQPLNFGAAQVSAESYPVGFTVYTIEKAKADDLEDQRIVRHTRSVQNNKPFRLPTGYTSDEYQVEVQGDSVVESVYIAETLRELNRV
jgi:hypothetical protein